VPWCWSARVSLALESTATPLSSVRSLQIQRQSWRHRVPRSLHNQSRQLTRVNLNLRGSTCARQLSARQLSHANLGTWVTCICYAPRLVAIADTPPGPSTVLSCAPTPRRAALPSAFFQHADASFAKRSSPVIELWHTHKQSRAPARHEHARATPSRNPGLDQAAACSSVTAAPDKAEESARAKRRSDPHGNTCPLSTEPAVGI